MKNQTTALILSLTTYGERLQTVHKTIQSLIKQTKKADKILLWLDQNEFSSDTLTQELKKLISKQFEIKFCPNWRSYKKLIPAVIEYPNAVIITFDDDIIYPSTLVGDLYKEHLISPQSIIASRGRIINIEEGDFAPYPSWQFLRNPSKISAQYCVVPIGYGGVLYPPNSLHEEVLNEKKFMSLAPHADDLWFKAMALLTGTKTIILPQDASSKMKLIEGTQESALFVTHNAGDANTEQMKAIAKAFYQINDVIQSQEFNSIELPADSLVKLFKNEEIVQFVSANTNLIRDSAIALEKHNMRFSYTLMEIAKSLRPKGPKISRLLERYKKALAR
jgi:hypothetical protein